LPKRGNKGDGRVLESLLESLDQDLDKYIVPFYAKICLLLEGECREILEGQDTAL